MMKKWKLSDFWKQTLSCTLGTIIGIILTFGTSAWIENREKKATERTAALMVIHNLDVFCDDLEETTKDLQAVDSINMKVLAAKDRLETVPEDTLELFVGNFFSFQFSPNDQTAETIFSSNIETWKSIDNSEFIELAGQCFSAKRFLVKFQERLEAEKNDLTDMFMKTVVYADKPTKSVPEIAASMLHSAAFCSFIKKQHDFYLQGMQQGLKVLLKQTDNCKRLMDVTDEELQLFGYNDETQESQRH
jgi:hypothetical protein